MRFWSALCGLLYSCMIFGSSMDINVDANSKTFSVKLPANPTTGYRWVVDSLDDVNFQKIAEKYLPSSPKRIGSGGQMCFTFERKKSSKALDETTIILKYQRTWEQKPVDVKTVVVHFNSKK